MLQRIAYIISNKINTSTTSNGETGKEESKKNGSPTKPKARKSSDPKVKVSRNASKDSPEIKKTKSKTLVKEDPQKTKKPKKIEKQKTIKDIEGDPITLGTGSTVQPDTSFEPQKNKETRKNSADLVKQKIPLKSEESGELNQVPSSERRKSLSGGSRKSSAEKKATLEERKSSGRKQSIVERNDSIPEEPSPAIPKKEEDKAEEIKPSEDISKKNLENNNEAEQKDLYKMGTKPEEPLKTETPADLSKKAPPPLSRQNSILNRPRTSLRPPSARPPSARPGAPRRRDKSIEIILQPNESTKAGGLSIKVDNVNTELEDDGENLIVIENSNVEEDIIGNSKIDQIIIDNEDHQKGHLVQQILETQKELVQEDKGDIEKALKERKNRQTSATQVDSLRGLIQILTKAVNPTGKLLDFIPEDIDSMQLELTMWRDTYSQAAAELKREKR